MISTSSQVIEDDKGAMTITRWRCRPCHETAEESWMSAGYRGPDPIRIRYAVAPLRKRRTPAAARGLYAYAGAL
jgi:hypothetical protein